MLSAQFADSSIDPLWSNKDRGVKRASLLYKSGNWASPMTGADAQDARCCCCLINSRGFLFTGHLVTAFLRQLTHHHTNTHPAWAVCQTGG